MIYMSVESSLGKVKLCQVSSLWDMCHRFYAGSFLAPSMREQPRKSPS